MIDCRRWPARSLLRAVVLSSARELGQKFASAWRLSQAHRYSTGFRSGAYPGSSAIWMAPFVLSRYSRTILHLCCAAPSQTMSSRRLSCERSGLRNSTICALLTAPSYSRNRKFVRVRPAMAETCFQLKWNCTTGVHPLGAQVLTCVGRSDSPSRTRASARRTRRATEDADACRTQRRLRQA
jgi:hypothetical protein